MKTSNVILAAWVLIVAGLALALVWYLKASNTTGPAGGVNSVVEVKDPGRKDPATKGGRDPATKGSRAGRAGTEPTPPDAPVEIEGRVVDVESKPIAGVPVHLLTPSKPTAPPAPPDATEMRRVMQIITVFDEDAERIRPLASWYETPAGETVRVTGPELAATVSAADGTFSFTVPSTSGRGPYHITARMDPIGSASAGNVYAGTPIELMLTSGGLVNGSVVGEIDGAAVPGARVVFDSGEREYAASTDEKGAFRIDGMPPGRFTVRAGAKGRTPILDQPIQVLRGEPVALKLPRGTTLRIRTVNAGGPEEELAEGTEPPVPNAEVVALEETAQIYVIGRSNDYGIVEFAGLPAGSWIVNGRAVNFVSHGDAQIEINENQDVVEDVVTFEPAVLTPIEVVDETGSPIPGVEFFTCDGYDAYDSVRSEKVPGATDRDGKFQYPFEFDGPRCMVFAFKKGFGLAKAFPDDYSAGEPIRLVMKKAIRVFGKVVDQKGAPVPDATVRLTFDPKQPEDSAAPTEEEDEEAMLDSQTVTIHTDAAGRYDFAFCPAGFEVSVEAETEDSWSDDMPMVEQVAGKTDYEVDLRLEPNEPEVRELIPGGDHPEMRDVPVRKVPPEEDEPK